MAARSGSASVPSPRPARPHLAGPFRRVLEPIDRTSEILFGLIMVLTFTGSLSVAQAGRDDVRAMLIGALGCNLAWAIIDAVFYLMGCLEEKNRDLVTARTVRSASDPELGRALIADSLPPLVAAVVQPSELESMRLRLNELPELPDHPRLDGDDWRAAVGVFLLVFLVTFPVTIPFMVMPHAVSALRVSNTIAIAMLFAMGYAAGRRGGRRRPWLMGVAMVILGAALVGLTIALGG